LALLIEGVRFLGGIEMMMITDWEIWLLIKTTQKSSITRSLHNSNAVQSACNAYAT
jgi:hypothetical protein